MRRTGGSNARPGVMTSTFPSKLRRERRTTEVFDLRSPDRTSPFC